MKEITGVMFSYSFLCIRKLWYFANNINMESEHENVSIGKLLDENTYKREDKYFTIDGMINIDFIKNNVVYEIKKSEAQIDMAINQVKYYLYILRKKGLDITEGIINIPTKKITEKVVLQEEDIRDIEDRLKMINDVIENTEVPKVNRIPACSNCAYYELCFI